MILCAIIALWVIQIKCLHCGERIYTKYKIISRTFYVCMKCYDKYKDEIGE
jgi:hypothetical protein